MNFEMGLCVRCDFGQPYVDTSVYVPVLLKNLCGMSCSGAFGSWVVVGFGVGMEAFGWSLIPSCSV